VLQSEQIKNPDARISFRGLDNSGTPLMESSECYQGVVTGDIERFTKKLWEVLFPVGGWVPFRRSNNTADIYGDVSEVLYWEAGNGQLHDYAREARVRLHDMHESGNRAWGRYGVAVNRIGKLKAVPYYGEHFDNNVAVVFPKKSDGPATALLAFAISAEFVRSVRALDQTLKVTNRTLLKVPFDQDRWAEIAKCTFSSGFPKPFSNDPTQFVFHGHPAKAEPATVLQVAVARLLGYRWPPELDPEMRLADEARKWVARCDDLLKFADEDGIVCIPSIRGESPAAERARALLAASFGEDWTPEKERELIAETGSKATDLDTWLRNDFFEQHCKLFHHRPFVWHIWDGRKRDGFHALVNYHKLAEGDDGGRRTLENLTYSYLGDWITRQKDGVRRGVAGAEDRLAAALELQQRLVAILEGELPLDLFIRWKPLTEQAIGWDPDINDGVRLNARPFMASDLPNGKKGAGVFRWKPNIKWGKDRGKEPISLRPKDKFPWFWKWDEQIADFLGSDEFDGNRWNDLHYTNVAKQAAREAAKEGGR
jgi:hypothetical protein